MICSNCRKRFSQFDAQLLLNGVEPIEIDEAQIDDNNGAVDQIENDPDFFIMTKSQWRM